MSETDDLAPPVALSCTDARLLFTTPQWVVYEARAEGQTCLAWAFLPAVARVELIGGRFAAPPLGPAYQAVSTKVEESARRLISQGERGWCRPRTVARSAEQALLWMRTQAPSSWLADRPRPAPLGIRNFALRLTLTLSRLHEQRIFHLDVHPRLIGYAPDKEMILCGFGADIRRALSAGQRDNRRLARPFFAPPELWDASGETPLGPWTDVYCAAATLFEWITGEPPPDFRERLGQPRDGIAALAERMYSALQEDEHASELMATAIAEGLATRRSDRPSDIAAWGRKLAISSAFAPSHARPGHSPAPPPPPPPQKQQAPPPGAAHSGVAAASAARASGHRITEPGRRESGKPGAYRALFGMVALIGLLVLGKLVWLSESPTGGGEANIAVADNLLSNEVEPLEPIASSVSEPAVPSGSLAGTAFEDDPDKLAERLRGLWGTLPEGFQPAALFLGYREPERGTCDNPLRIHYRQDGNGLVVDRPAGLVWITRWSDAGQANPGDLSLVIDSVWSRDSEVDAPGLVGTSRSLRLAGGEMEIAVPSVEQDGASGDREVYAPCPA